MTAETAAADDPYTIRHYQPGDEDDYLALYNDIWSTDRTDAWFKWRYPGNPYVEDVPMYVAEFEGRVVATRPFLAFRVRADDATRLAFLCADTMTHPDHRRRGLFTRTMERALSDYQDRPPAERPAFFFNHSNEFSRPGNRALGFEYGSPQVHANRVQRAGSYVADAAGGRIGGVLGSTATAANRGVLALVDGLARRSASSSGSGPSASDRQFEVERLEEVPAASFAAAYDDCRPASVHVVYDQAFYEWRFAEPGNEPAAVYVARRDGRIAAALVTHRRHDSRNDTEQVTISHVVPAAGGPEWRGALAAALDRLLRDCARADIVRTANPLLPRSLLSRRGFLPDDRLPMSRLAEQSGLVLGMRPLAPGEWTLGGRPIRGAEPYLWTLA